jgi:hypothetical protein
MNKDVMAQEISAVRGYLQVIIEAADLEDKIRTNQTGYVMCISPSPKLHNQVSFDIEIGNLICCRGRLTFVL